MGQVNFRCLSRSSSTVAKKPKQHVSKSQVISVSLSEHSRFPPLWGSVWHKPGNVWCRDVFVPADIPGTSHLTGHTQSWSSHKSRGQGEEKERKWRIRRHTVFQQQFSGQKRIPLVFFSQSCSTLCTRYRVTPFAHCPFLTLDLNKCK